MEAQRGDKRAWLVLAAALLGTACGTDDAGDAKATTAGKSGNGAGGSSSSSGGSSGKAGSNSDAGTGGSTPTSADVVVSPASPHATSKATIQFSAIVSGMADTTVKWAVQEGEAGGTITNGGLYTAPEKDGTYHVTATTTKMMSGVATVFVNTPSDCSALAATARPMTWELISPTATTGSSSIVVDPFDSATVWAAAAPGFHKSTDCGATWEHRNTGAGAELVDKGALWSIAVDPVVKDTMYVVGAYGALGLWKTTDGGQNFTQLFGPDSDWAKAADQNFVNNVSMNPDDHLQLIVTQHGTCKGFDTACMAETLDGGDSWHLTAGPKSWGEGGGAQILNKTSWIWGGAQGFSGLQLTTDNGKSWKELLGGGKGDANGEFTTRPLVRQADGFYYISAMQGVLQSQDGMTWTNVKEGRLVGIAFGKKSIFVSDQWSDTVLMGSYADLKTWTKLPAPTLAAGEGCPYLEYDPAHSVLYASCFKAGIWRMLVPE